MTSDCQDQWVDICAAVRAYLAKQVELMPAMTVEEAGTFVKTLDDAMWLETKAASYDVGVEERRCTLEREAQFGG